MSILDKSSKETKNYNLVPSSISSCENALTELLECYSDPKFTARIRSKYVKNELGISLKR